ncbi:MAG: DUF4296 domain-containing protein [Bacteroidales bacterium]|nr:DUF4296 domain-containing protein [Bacteroidales bacterium]
MNKRTLTIASIALLVLIVGAYVLIQRSRNVVPSERRMAQMMADVYIADALIQVKGNLYSATGKNDKGPESAYHTILDRYGLNKAEYDSAISWYSAHPDKYAKVYEILVNILTQRESDYSVIIDKRDSIAKLITHLNDSLRVSFWQGQKHLHVPIIPADSVKGKDLRFEYDLDSIRGGKVSFSMNYTFLRDNEAKERPLMEMIVVYNDTISDTATVSLDLSHLQHKAELEYAVRDTLCATKMKVDLMKSSEFKKTKATLSNVSITYMPYQITDSIQFDEILLPPLFAY